MADDANTNSGSVPDPIPEVRDEGPGGTDLSFEENRGDVRGGEDTGSIPQPTPNESSEGPESTD